MDELIRKADAIKALGEEPVVWMNDDDFAKGERIQWEIDVLSIETVPTVDRPQGDVDAVDILMREMHNLEQGYITIGEFDERIEPLRHLCYGRPKGR